MSFAYLRASLVVSLTLSPAVALAGGVMTGGTTDAPGTSSGGMATGDTDGTDSGGTDGFETDTDTDSGTSTGGGSSESCGEIGECEVSMDSVVIVSPMTGAEVGRPFDLQVTAPHTCYCSPCGCFTGPPNRVTIRVDGMTFTSCETGECDTMDHTFSLDLAPGPHTIDAVADVELSPEFSAPIEVTVVGEVATGDSSGDGGPPPPPPMPGTTSGGDDSSGTSGAAADDGGGGGCGCNTDATPRGALGALFGLVLLTSLRRRRH